jgi:Tol biopolymer transport system component
LQTKCKIAGGNKMKQKALLIGLMSTFFLAGCLEVLSIPTLSLSADGQKMAFLVQTNAGQSMSLQVLNLEDGTTEEIGNPETMKGAFDWHPSQTALAYVEITPEQSSSIQIAELSGEISELIQMPENVWVNQMAYSPDGSLLALSLSLLPQGKEPSQVLDFSTDLNPSAIRVVLINIGTGDYQEILREQVGDSPSLDWSPDGSRFAYGFDGRIYVYDLSVEEASLLNWEDNLSLRSPSWLSDTHLVLLSAPDPDGIGPSITEIVSVDLSSGTRQAWAVPGSTAVPTASPDGQYIAYLEGRASSDPDLSDQGYASATTTVMLLDVNQDSALPIYVGVSLDRPLWSKDSQTLYISNGNAFSMSVGNRRQIFAVDIASGESNALYEGAVASSSLMGWFPPQEATESP